MRNLVIDCMFQILELIKPRLIFGGHTHNFCYTEHADQAREWTLASFSWRYKSTPSFLLVSLYVLELTQN